MGRTRGDLQNMSAESVDEIIRRRFRCCETLPLFPESPPCPPSPPPLPPGFFLVPEVGPQLRLFDRKPPASSRAHP